MNNRRLSRIELSNSPIRARKYKDEFTSKQLELFLAIYFSMCLSPQPGVRDYFRTGSSQTPVGNSFIPSLMTYTLWVEMYRCLEIDSEKYLMDLENCCRTSWRLGTNLSLDESMIPHQGRKNPHHLFVPRKPHPHGLKLYTLADSSRFLFSQTSQLMLL
eukprot:Pompholyxophrys_sp_v1_NODE_139_length_1613_cov_10.258023.p1 type:complete len:159 gc:universal NODE_139_length_1613_cov_10.258023:961-485(-)